MTIKITALVLLFGVLLGFANWASASSVCDIDGCHPCEHWRESWNEYYITHYEFAYDAGYRRESEGNGLGGIGRCFGYGAGALCDRKRLPNGYMANPVNP